MPKEKHPQKNASADNKKPGKLFSIFSTGPGKGGRGVTKKQAEFNGKYDLYNFFTFLRYRFGDITKLNLLFILANFSIVFLLYSLTGNTQNELPTPSTPLYQQLYGMAQYNPTSPAVLAYTGVYGVMTTISVWTTLTKVLVYSGFTLLFTFGLSSAGVAYVTRAFIRREQVFVWHDFWGAVKKNWKQSIVIGIFDLVICFLLYNSLVFYSANRVTYLMQVFFYLVIAFAILYFIMRMYFYFLTITFDLSIFKIFKNSFIFTLLGIKRNIVAVLAMGLAVLINAYIFTLLPSVGVMLPFIFTLGFLFFISAYCVFPVIDKFMIKPYYKEESISGEKPIFTDRG
ncbi:MAG: DUF624 domain-containing protein [Eubacteriales bacterium]